MSFACSGKSSHDTADAGVAVAPASTPTPIAAGKGAFTAPDLATTLKDPAFVRAASTHDPIDLAALGAHAGAAALVLAMADPASRATALSAIPYARDSDLAFAPLASAAKARPGTDDAVELLDTLSFATEEPRHLGELLDPEGVHAAATDLLAIARDGARPDRERALAATILGRLADRGFMARSEIPAL